MSKFCPGGCHQKCPRAAFWKLSQETVQIYSLALCRPFSFLLLLGAQIRWAGEPPWITKMRAWPCSEEERGQVSEDLTEQTHPTSPRPLPSGLLPEREIKSSDLTHCYYGVSVIGR